MQDQLEKQLDTFVANITVRKTVRAMYVSVLKRHLRNWGDKRYKDGLKERK